MSVYQLDAICGPVAELSPELYHRWGQSLGRRLGEGNTMVVGGDVRLTTPAFKAALVTGLCEAGVQAVDLGILPTPMVDFALRHLRATGCAMVTASHHLPEINGLLWMIRDLPADEAEVEALRREAESGVPCSLTVPGTIEACDIAPHYIAWLRSIPYFREVDPSFHVIIDAGNGCWAARAAAYAQAVFPHLRIETLHDVEDGHFPHRHPDIGRVEQLSTLRDLVLARGANLGIAFDGDGDRVAFVDERGHTLSAEETTWVLMLSFWEGLRDRAFVYDIRLSDRIAEGVRALGGEPQMERSGHAAVRRRMMEEGGIFGAEASGHYFYGDLDGGDDGLYTALRMLAHLARAETSLAELLRTCPAIFITPELCFPLDAAARQATLRQVCEAFPHHPQTTVEGIRVDFPGGWALARESAVDSMLVFRFEGHSADALERIVGEFRHRVPLVGEGLWEQYRKAVQHPMRN